MHRKHGRKRGLVSREPRAEERGRRLSHVQAELGDVGNAPRERDQSDERRAEGRASGVRPTYKQSSTAMAEAIEQRMDLTERTSGRISE